MPCTTKTKILVVDDDPKLSKLVKLVLEKTSQYDVLEENRSSQALGVARKFEPSLILLDVDMPGKDGGELAREMAVDSVLKKVPVMFFTSLVSHQEAGSNAIERAGKWYLAKPVMPEVLVRSVEYLLNLSRGVASAA